ncbi:MAG: RNA polymerase sigma factor [bacterium]|nr:RNA polymerase sigma factor [bacterium]
MTEQTNGPAPGGRDEGERRRAVIEAAVSALQDGRDFEANFKIVFEVFYRPLQRFFTKKGFLAEEAQDLTQETLLGIYRGVRRFRHEARFETWLYRVATTTYLKRLRSGSAAKRSGVETPYDEVAIDTPSVAAPEGQLDGVLDEEKRRAMREAIEELPEKMRKCLTLRVYQDLSYREIAVVMKLKINTVKAHLFQAREKLRGKLEAYSLEASES